MKSKLILAALCGMVAAATVAYAADLSSDQLTRLRITFGDKELAEAVRDTVDFTTQKNSLDPTTYGADADITRATLRTYGVFRVTPKNGVDLDLSNDADLEDEDIGREWIFYVSSAGNSAVGFTLTDGGSGVKVQRVNTVGTHCEDITDHIRCTAVAAEAIYCSAFCAD